MGKYLTVQYTQNEDKHWSQNKILFDKITLLLNRGKIKLHHLNQYNLHIYRIAVTFVSVTVHCLSLQQKVKEELASRCSDTFTTAHNQRIYPEEELYVNNTVTSSPLFVLDILDSLPLVIEVCDGAERRQRLLQRDDLKGQLHVGSPPPPELLISRLQGLADRPPIPLMLLRHVLYI